jgi:hypothetical protein
MIQTGKANWLLQAQYAQEGAIYSMGVLTLLGLSRKLWNVMQFLKNQVCQLERLIQKTLDVIIHGRTKVILSRPKSQV